MPHPMVGTEIQPGGDKLNKMHSARLNHANARMVYELIELADPRVNAVLERFSAIVVPGPRIALEYPQDVPQLYEKEIRAIREAKEALEEGYKQESPVAPAPPHCCDPFNHDHE